jgi:Xaa-Pro aminopeptidase
MFEQGVYVSRRKALKDQIKNGILVFIGNNDSPMNYSANPYHFRQDSNFLYFFGLNYQGLAAVIDADSGDEIIYGDDIDLDDVIWMGPQPSIAEKADLVGISNVKPFTSLFDEVEKAKASNRKIHFLPPYRHDNLILISRLTGLPIAQVKENASIQFIKAVISLREVKDHFEIEEIESAASIGYEMHTVAMRMAKPGVLEQEIAGHIEGIALKRGSGVSFPVILSIHGETLHNHYHGNTMRNGDLLLVDAGAESNRNYCSDFTRTIPVSGKFTQKQKEIYDIVLQANNTAIESIKPGIKYQDVHLKTAEVIIAGLKNLGLMKGNVTDALRNGAHAMFFPHGLGHMMGLDVHDMEDLGENHVGYDDHTSRINQFGTAYLRLGKTLKPGFVLTVEPGIYFIPALIEKWKSEKINAEFIDFEKVSDYIGFGGIRLEDDILVTDQGCRFLGNRIPIKSNEIEDWMNLPA